MPGGEQKKKTHGAKENKIKEAFIFPRFQGGRGEFNGNHGGKHDAEMGYRPEKRRCVAESKVCVQEVPGICFTIIFNYSKLGVTLQVYACQSTQIC